MRRCLTLLQKVERRISKSSGDVFLTREFKDLGSEGQVSRALRSIVKNGGLVRLGHGVYGRAVKSRLSGKPVLYAANGFTGAVRQALTKLGVDWGPTDSERAYNAGSSTQIPVNPVLRIKGRCSRQLSHGGLKLKIIR